MTIEDSMSTGQTNELKGKTKINPGYQFKTNQKASDLSAVY